MSSHNQEMTQHPRPSGEQFYTPTQTIASTPLPPPSSNALSSHPAVPDRTDSLNTYGSTFHNGVSVEDVTIDVGGDEERAREGDYNEEGGNEKGKGSDRSMEIYWEDIRYTISTGKGKNKKEREILMGVGGRVRPGEMVAIMGGSGAGKSTLLNILSGRIPSGKPTGLILANGKIRDRTRWKKLVGYVEQEDLMYSNLTVRETLTTAARLRLPNTHFSRKQKLARVDEVLAMLGLTHVADTRIGDSTTGGISGGEKKRVSIGIELVTDPGTLFLDEPTTGLDSATALNIAEMLKELAVEHRKTIICTIHMPRETILDKFDHVALMSQGRMVWFGPSKAALEHFERLGYKCPPHTNPADYSITPDTRDPNSKKRVDNLCAEWDKIKDKMVQPIDRGLSEKAHNTRDAVQKNKKAAKGLRRDWEDGSRKESVWGVGWVEEVMILLGRHFKQLWRSSVVLISTAVQTFIIFLLIGFVFFQIKRDQASIQNRYGVLFFICINQTFSYLMPIITVFPLERRIILRERAAKSYRTSTVFLAKSISQWPLAAISSLGFTLAVYYLVGLNHLWTRYILFVVISQCLVLAAQSLGLLIGSAVPSVQIAQVFGPLIVVIFVVFGGNFANSSSITPVLRWIQWISPIRYAYAAYMQNEFNGLQFECGSSPGGSGGGSGAGGGRCFEVGDQVVESFGLNDPPLWACLVILLGLSAVFQILAAFVLRFTTRPRLQII
ncbi:ATP-binding cassette sub- G member 2 [Rhizophlyctis rosea]|nr:ATP-binding cassette sub- G member 2 [Rhizophlyctis rosea]